MTQPVKLSPIQQFAEKWQGQFVMQEGWQVVQMYRSLEAETAVAQQSIALCDQSHNSKIRVEGQTAGQLLQADELAINAGKQLDDGYVYRLRRELFFVHTAVPPIQHTTTDLITITDVTHGNAELWLVGPRSAELLSRLCGLDFHDSQFPNHTAKQSSLAKTTQLIIRRDVSKLPAYGIIGTRSLGMYLWPTLMQAGRDLGIEPIGLAAFNQLQLADKL
jgi:sarcosine oxidase subunit alpha